jgi:manganese transport protein
MIPLVIFTNSRRVMGEFTNNRLTQVLAWASTLIILSLNAVLLIQIFGG